MEVSNKPYAASRVRFGSFEIDLQSGELRKAGARVRLQAQPFRVLSVLVEHAGEVVSREELQQRLWGSATTVDFDHGLNIAVNKLREVLEDSAEYPRFIETLSRRGYRFVAAISVVDEAAPARTALHLHELPSETRPLLPNRLQPRKRIGWLLTGAASSALLLIPLLLSQRTGGTHLVPLPIREVTYSGRVYPGLPLQESLAQTATDGSRIYFPQIENGRAVLSQASIRDGETSKLPISSTILAPIPEDISPDRSKILVRNQLARETEGPLWIVPALGGAAKQFSNVLAHDATWMPDGQKILYATGTDLMVANEDGSDRRKLASLPGRAFWLRWSPDGKLLRFTLINSLDHVNRSGRCRPTGRRYVHCCRAGISPRQSAVVAGHQTADTSSSSRHTTG